MVVYVDFMAERVISEEAFRKMVAEYLQDEDYFEEFLTYEKQLSRAEIFALSVEDKIKISQEFFEYVPEELRDFERVVVEEYN